MRSSAYLSKDNIILQSFLILCLGITLFAFTREVYYVLALPILAGGFFLLLFLPESIPYIFIATNFYGGFVFERINIAVTITDIFFCIVIFAYFASLRKNNSIEVVHEKNPPVLYLLILFFISSLLSFSLNISTFENKFVYFSIWYLIKCAQLPFVFFVFMHCHITKLQIERFITLCLILSLLQLPVVLFQYYNVRGDAFGISRTGIHGTLTYHHTLLGTFMLIPLFLSLYRLLKENTRSGKIVYICMTISFMIIIIFSGSRSALLGIVFSAVLFFFSHFKFKKKIIIYITVFLLSMTALYFLTPLKSLVTLTFQSKETKFLDISSASRFLIWAGAIKHFLSSDMLHKLFGIGIGAFQTIQYDFVFWGSSRSASGAHNNFIHILLEIGIIGLIIYSALFYTILKKLYIHFSNPLSKVFFFLTLALLASSITQETFWFQKSFGSLWLFYMFFVAIVFQSVQRIEIE